MKIGITCLAGTGGSGILATELGIAIAERGHTVHFVTYNHQPFRLRSFHDRVFSHCVEVSSYPQLRHPPYSMALMAKIAEVAEENDIDLWHAHYAVPHAACAHMARTMLPPEHRFKVITTLHGTDITLVGLDPSYFRLTRFAIEHSDGLTAVSNWLARETQREFDLSRPVRTIYNFLNVQRFSTPTADRRCLADDDEKIVMHLSNFRPVKRVTDVVRAFNKVCRQVPARLIMVGEGPERMSAVGVARQLGISDKVRLLGNVENVESIIPLADLVFQPSEHESFGLVALEAMVCGVPFLGTASGGVVEVVECGTTGYLCEVGDTETMAARAIQLLTDEALAKQMGRRGRERAARLFSKERIVDQYEALYCELLDA